MKHTREEERRIQWWGKFWGDRIVGFVCGLFLGEEYENQAFT